MAFPFRLLQALIPLFFLLGASTPARATFDYHRKNSDWNGITDLLQINARYQADLKPKILSYPILNWRQLLPAQDALFFLYPLTEIDFQSLMNFIKDGGRVIIADDFGNTGHILNYLGVKKVQGPFKSPRYYAGNENMPIVSPPLNHFLFYNIKEVVTNHPAGFIADKYLAAYPEPETGWVLERSIGKGSLVLIADPSIFINIMLRHFYGNLQFAVNLSRYICTDMNHCRLHILTATFGQKEVYLRQWDLFGRLKNSTQAILAFLNAQIQRLAELKMNENFGLAIKIGLLCIALILLIIILPFSTPFSLTTFTKSLWNSLSEDRPNSYERVIYKFTQKRHTYNFIYLAALLKIAIARELQKKFSPDLLKTLENLPGPNRREKSRFGVEKLLETFALNRKDQGTLRQLLQFYFRLPNKEELSGTRYIQDMSYAEFCRVYRYFQQLQAIHTKLPTKEAYLDLYP